jgi:hypothetical protein
MTRVRLGVKASGYASPLVTIGVPAIVAAIPGASCDVDPDGRTQVEADWPEGVTLGVPDLPYSIGVSEGCLVLEVPRMAALFLQARGGVKSITWGTSTRLTYDLAEPLVLDIAGIVSIRAELAP